MIKKLLRSPIATAMLFVLAAGLIGYGGINTVLAAPRIQSEWFGMQVELRDITTALVENDTIVYGDDDLLGEDRFLAPNGLEVDEDTGIIKNFKVGMAYDEVLKVKNDIPPATQKDRNVTNKDNAIDEWVRVTVRVSWVDAKGNKRTDLDPSLIVPHFVTGNGWTIDTKASTPERTVLYYDKILKPGEISTPFMDKLVISSDVLSSVTENEDHTEYEYDYKGVKFRLEAKVDAVQTHSKDEAMQSAWGEKK